MISPKRFEGRLDRMVIIAILVFVALVARLSYLQVVNGREYEKLADGNRIRLLPIMAPRGIFYDRYGVQLVSNRPGFTVSLVPTSGPIDDNVLVKLAEILQMDVNVLREKAKQRTGFDTIRVKNNVGSDIIIKVEEHRSQLPGVVIEVQPIRNYINKEVAAHLFGYVGEINDEEVTRLKPQGYVAGNIIGKTAMEQLYDKMLRGTDGGEQVEVDVTGRPVQVLGKKDPIPGNNLFLTIDFRIQLAAEQAMDEQLALLQKSRYSKAKAAAAVVLDPRTGEVLAMASRPTYDPNLFAGGISEKNWKSINENPFDPMTNKALTGEYPPGSIFKIVTGTAALELGKVTPEEKLFDSGVYWIIPKKNAGNEALGWINFSDALAHSDNVYFYEMGYRLGIDNIEKYSRIFGLGQPSGINLPGEAEGLVPNKKYKEKVYKEDWYLSETLDAAIGQGFHLTTPLQIANLISTVANGGIRYKPYVISKIVSPDGQTVQTFGPEEMGRIGWSNKTLSLIREGLRRVSEDGTAGYVFDKFPVSVAGKTGTAENPHGDDHGWFVAYAPADNPRIAVAVIVEQGGYGASSAAPIARKILEAAFGLNKSVLVPPEKALRAGTVL